MVTSLVIISIADRLSKPDPTFYHPITAFSIAGYLFALILVRFLESGSVNFYEMAWACNTSIVLSVIGCLTGRPLLIGASVAAVIFDQILWYIDFTSYLITGKMPVGAASYFLWPETSFIKKLTSFHHLWFLPVCLYCLDWSIPMYSTIMGMVLTDVLAILSRPLCPLYYQMKTSKDSVVPVYLNVNIAHAFWRDAKLKYLHIADDKPWYIYFILLFMFGAVINGVPMMLLQLILPTSMPNN